MQVWVYEEPEAEGEDGNLYVHHDVMLPAFPLAVAWLDCDPGQRRERANLAAVGGLSLVSGALLRRSSGPVPNRCPRSNVDMHCWLVHQFKLSSW
jgi:hypothetical protein